MTSQQILLKEPLIYTLLLQDFPGGPVGKSMSPVQGAGFSPSSGTKTLHCAAKTQINKH